MGRNEFTSEEVKPADGNGSTRDSRNRLNDLSAKEWIAETVSVWTQRGLGKGHHEAKIEREHPAPFSFQDVARLVRFFTKMDQQVLDPFVGVGSTLKAAALEGRHGLGIELNPRYASLAQERMGEIDGRLGVCWDQRVLNGDAEDLLPTLEPKSVHLVLTSPPYWNILHKQDHKAKQDRVEQGLDSKYGEDTQDLGNIVEYEVFLQKLGDILGLCWPLLVSGGHMCIVVGDFRHQRRYYMFHADLAKVMEERGFLLQGLKILHQKHKRVFPYGYPYAYVPNLHHQYIVILKKEG